MCPVFTQTSLRGKLFIMQMIEEVQSIVACLDIEKVFDKVWQNGLLYKLHEKGINSTLWQIICRFM